VGGGGGGGGGGEKTLIQCSGKEADRAAENSNLFSADNLKVAGCYRGTCRGKWTTRGTSEKRGSALTAANFPMNS